MSVFLIKIKVKTHFSLQFVITIGTKVRIGKNDRQVIKIINSI
jgi:hypothetical protein